MNNFWCVAVCQQCRLIETAACVCRKPRQQRVSEVDVGWQQSRCEIKKIKKRFSKADLSYIYTPPFSGDVFVFRLILECLVRASTQISH